MGQKACASRLWPDRASAECRKVAVCQSDYHKVDPLVVLAVGDFTGSELEVDCFEPTRPTHEVPLIDAQVWHYSLPLESERYSVVALTRWCHLEFSVIGIAASREQTGQLRGSLLRHGPATSWAM